jgi:TIR domain
MSKVFISYRRVDSLDEAGRLSDSLTARLGRSNVFRDVDGIEPGQHFERALDAALSEQPMVVALIGPKWLAELQRRQSLPDTDYVHMELARSLARGLHVIPVLLKGATMPQPQQLPEDLRGLSPLQALSMRDEAWAEDTGRLLKGIGLPYRWGLLALRALAYVAVALAAVYWLDVPLDVARGFFISGLLVYAAAEAAAGIGPRMLRARRRAQLARSTR